MTELWKMAQINMSYWSLLCCDLQNPTTFVLCGAGQHAFCLVVYIFSKAHNTGFSLSQWIKLYPLQKNKPREEGWFWNCFPALWKWLVTQNQNKLSNWYNVQNVSFHLQSSICQQANRIYPESPSVGSGSIASTNYSLKILGKHSGYSKHVYSFLIIISPKFYYSSDLDSVYIMSSHVFYVFPRDNLKHKRG